MPAVDLVGIGLNATDTIIQLDHYPERGAKGEYQAAQVLPGGQVATVTVACALWGLRTRYVGKLGDDDAAALHRREFARARVDAQLLTESGAPSLQSLILVDASGERTVLNRRDARLAAPSPRSCTGSSWTAHAASTSTATIPLQPHALPAGLSLQASRLWPISMKPMPASTPCCRSSTTSSCLVTSRSG